MCLLHRLCVCICHSACCMTNFQIQQWANAVFLLGHTDVNEEEVNKEEVKEVSKIKNKELKNAYNDFLDKMGQ